MLLEQIDRFVWEIPRAGGMKVPGRVYLAPQQLEQVHEDKALEQVANVAHLPGIVGHSLAMPDIHWGYGFPIGGVAAVDADQGAVSPGGVGYDINCGVRVVTTRLTERDVRPYLRKIIEHLFATIPTGVGASKAIPKLKHPELAAILSQGASWAIERGFRAGADDAAHCEEGGQLRGADPDAVPARALERGADQLGTLGSGNHFLELQRVAEIYDQPAAAAFGLRTGEVTLMIHSGSRGLGHQTCDETLRELSRTYSQYGTDYAALPDRQLACAPIRSDLGQRYLGAMQAAANFAWANRQVMTGLALQALARALGIGDGELGASLLYDVCHNIAKFEDHLVDGASRRVLVHRKGATRAFGPDDPRVPEAYRAVGQPVMIPGDMGRYSFVLAGNAAAMTQTFGSSCHGAGRVLSRTAALKLAKGRRIDRELRERGIEVMSRGVRTLGEEMSEAYKDVQNVVDVIDGAGISRKVAKLVPLGMIKG
jgi:tRNA-splicing ligase RtcB (3'-phosphate/5'-hydroxy nucleic acid ligase)